MDPKCRTFFADKSQQCNPFKQQLATSIYKVKKRIVMKNEDLPFSNTSKRIKNPASDRQPVSECNQVLQRTYAHAFPRNPHPLSKLQVAPTLSTTNEIFTLSKSTKYCKYNKNIEKAIENAEHIERDL